MAPSSPPSKRYSAIVCPRKKEFVHAEVILKQHGYKWSAPVSSKDAEQYWNKNNRKTFLLVYPDSKRLRFNSIDDDKYRESELKVRAKEFIDNPYYWLKEIEDESVFQSQKVTREEITARTNYDYGDIVETYFFYDKPFPDRIQGQPITAEILEGLIKSLGDKTTKKKSMIQQLTDALKKYLPGNIQTQYKAGLRNGDLELTREGRDIVLEIAANEYEEKLTAKAQEIIDEAEKEDN